MVWSNTTTRSTPVIRDYSQLRLVFLISRYETCMTSPGNCLLITTQTSATVDHNVTRVIILCDYEGWRRHFQHIQYRRTFCNGLWFCTDLLVSCDGDTSCDPNADRAAGRMSISKWWVYQFDYMNIRSNCTLCMLFPLLTMYLCSMDFHTMSPIEPKMNTVAVHFRSFLINSINFNFQF